MAKFTVVKWEGGRLPRYEKKIRALREGIPGVREVSLRRNPKRG